MFLNLRYKKFTFSNFIFIPEIEVRVNQKFILLQHALYSARYQTLHFNLD